MYADTLDEKVSRLILNEMVTGGKSYVKMDSPQMMDIITITESLIISGQ